MTQNRKRTRHRRKKPGSTLSVLLRKSSAEQLEQRLLLAAHPCSDLPPETICHGDILDAASQLHAAFDSLGGTSALQQSIPFLAGVEFSDVFSMGDAIRDNFTELLEVAADQGGFAFSLDEIAAALGVDASAVSYDADENVITIDAMLRHDFEVASYAVDLKSGLGDLEQIQVPARSEVEVNAFADAAFSLGIDLDNPNADVGLSGEMLLADLNGGDGVLGDAAGDGLSVTLRDGQTFEFEVFGVTSLDELAVGLANASKLDGNARLEVGFDGATLRLVDVSRPIAGGVFRITSLDDSLTAITLGLEVPSEEEQIEGTSDTRAVIKSEPLLGQSRLDSVFVQPADGSSSIDLDLGANLTTSELAATGLLGALELTFDGGSVSAGLSTTISLVPSEIGNGDNRITIRELLDVATDASLPFTPEFNGSASFTLPVVPDEVPFELPNAPEIALSIPQLFERVDGGGNDPENGSSTRIVDLADLSNVNVDLSGLGDRVASLKDMSMTDIIEALRTTVGFLQTLENPDDAGGAGSTSIFNQELPLLDASLSETLDIAEVFATIVHEIQQDGNPRLNTLEELLEDALRLPESSNNGADGLPTFAVFTTPALNAGKSLHGVDLANPLAFSFSSKAGEYADLSAYLKSLQGDDPLIDVSIDNSFGRAALRLDTQLDMGRFVSGGDSQLIEEQVPLSIDLADVVPGLSDLVDASSDALLTLEANATVQLGIGLDLMDGQTRPFLYTGDESTFFDIGAKATGDINLQAAVGPIGIEIADGMLGLTKELSSSEAASIKLALHDGDDVQDGRVYLTSLPGEPPKLNEFKSNLGNFFDVNIDAAVSTSLPIRFPGLTELAIPEPVFEISIPELGNLDFGKPTLGGEQQDDAVEVKGESQFEAALDAMRGNFNLLAMVGGWDGAFNVLVDAMRGEVFGIELPMVGDVLKDQAAFLTSIQTAVSGNFSGNEEAIANDDNGEGPLYETVRSLLFESLGPAGLNALADLDGDGDIALAVDPSLGDIKVELNDLTSNNPGVAFELLLADEFELLDLPLELANSLPGLNFELDAKVEGTVRYDFPFRFGVDLLHGFFVDTQETQIDVGVEFAIPNLSATGELGFLRVNARELDSGVPNGLSGNFQVRLKDPGTSGDDNLLSAAELTRIRNPADIVDVGAQFAAQLNSLVTVDLGAVAGFPSIRTKLLVDWNFDVGDSAQFPTVEFVDLEMNAGEFFSGFVTDVFDNIETYVGPVRPVVDFLTDPIPVIKQLGKKISFLDLAKLSKDKKLAAAVQFIDALDVVLKLVDALPDDFGEEWIPLGDADLRFPPGPDGKPTVSIELKNSSLAEIEELIQSKIRDPESKGMFSAETTKHATGMNVGFPLLNPINVFKMLTGESADLFTLELPKFELGFKAKKTFRFPPVPALGIVFRGNVSAAIDLAFGYDTLGIQQYLKTGNEAQIANGFFLFDHENPDGSGKDIAELILKVGLSAGGAIDAVVASASVNGGITAKANFNWHDNDDDGKVRLTELIENFSLGNKPFRGIHVFDISGNVKARLFAELDYTIDSEQYDFFKPKTLFNFNVKRPQGGAVKLATKSGDTLLLNIGPRAGERTEGVAGAILKQLDPGLVVDGNETFFLSPGSTPNSVIVTAFGREQEFENVSIIQGDAGKGNDTIEVSEGLDIRVELAGGAGNDTIIGGGAADRIEGGAGKDALSGGPGNDYVSGDSGNDQIRGDGGDDELRGGPGNDQLIGGDGDDDAHGEGGADKILGGPGNDVLQGGTGNDQILGDFGDDRILGELGDDQLTGGDGADTVIGGPGADLLRGGAGSDLLFGDDEGDESSVIGGDDEIFGGIGNDTIFGGAGNDQLFGESSRDTIYGGPGDDLIEGGAAGDELFGGLGDDDIYANTKNSPQSSTFAHVLIGGAGSDEIHGDLGNDLVHGDGVNDSAATDTPSLSGGDAIFTYAGHDEIHAGGGNDTVDAGGGDDFVVGGLGDDDLKGNAGDDAIFGGTNVVSANDFDLGNPDKFSLTITNSQFIVPPLTPASETFHRIMPSFLTSVSVLGTQSDGRDVIDGGPDNDWLFGGGDIDELLGGAGRDYLDGGAHNDLASGGSGDDVVRGNDGDDELSGGSGIDLLFGDLGDDELKGDADTNSSATIRQRLFGGEGDDKLYAWSPSTAIGALGDELFGGPGADTLYGSPRNELLEGEAGGDIILADHVFGSDYMVHTAAATAGGNDIIRGGRGEDQLFGGGGDDEIWGGANSDSIDGQAGADQTYGGSGIDKFITALGDEAIDTVDGHGGNVSLDDVPDDNATDILVIRGTNTSDTIVLSQNSAADNTLNIRRFGSRDILVNWADSDGVPRIEQFQIAGLSGNDTIGFGFNQLPSGLPQSLDLSGDPRLQLDFSKLSTRDFVGVFDGGAGDDVLVGADLRDRLDGGIGSDVVYGLGGNDRLWGDSGNGNSGDSDVLFAGQGNDDLFGGHGRNALLAWSSSPLNTEPDDQSVFQRLEAHSNAAAHVDFTPNANFGVFIDADGALLQENTGLNRIIGNRVDDLLFGGTSVDFLFGKGGDDVLLRKDGTRFESLDAGLAGDEWKAAARATDSVWYVAGTNANDEIRVDFVTEPGLLAGHHLVTRLTDNAGQFSFSAQVRLDFDAIDDDGNRIWDASDIVVNANARAAALDALETAGNDEVRAALLADVESTTRRLVDGLLPSEGDFQVIIVDALEGNDEVTIGPTVQKSVWIDAGPGEDRVMIRSGKVATDFPKDRLESDIRNDVRETPHDLGLVNFESTHAGLTLDGRQDVDWYQFQVPDAGFTSSARLVVRGDRNSEEFDLVIETMDGDSVSVPLTNPNLPDEFDRMTGDRSIGNLGDFEKLEGLTIPPFSAETYSFDADTAGGEYSIQLGCGEFQGVANECSDSFAPLSVQFNLERPNRGTIEVTGSVESLESSAWNALLNEQLMAVGLSLGDVRFTGNGSDLRLVAVSSFAANGLELVFPPEINGQPGIPNFAEVLLDLPPGARLTASRVLPPMTLTVTDDLVMELQLQNEFGIPYVAQQGSTIDLEGLAPGEYNVRVINPSDQAKLYSLESSVGPADLLIRGTTPLLSSGNSLPINALDPDTSYRFKVSNNGSPTNYEFQFDFDGHLGSRGTVTGDANFNPTTQRRDVILGGAGDDVLIGGVGEDLIFGQDGDDVLSGGRDQLASDLLFGGRGNDLFQLIPDELKTGASGSSDQYHGDAGFDQVVYLGGDVDHRGIEVPDYAAIRYNTVLHRYEFGALVWDIGHQKFLADPTDSNSYLKQFEHFTTKDVEGMQISLRHGDDVFRADSGFRFSRVDTESYEPDEWGIKRGDEEQGAVHASLVVRGGRGDDQLLGGFLNDRLHGDSGDDLLAGGPGNDELIDTTGENLLFGNAVADSASLRKPDETRRNPDLSSPESYRFDIATIGEFPVSRINQKFQNDGERFFGPQVFEIRDIGTTAFATTAATLTKSLEVSFNPTGELPVGDTLTYSAEETKQAASFRVTSKRGLVVNDEITHAILVDEGFGEVVETAVQSQIPGISIGEATQREMPDEFEIQVFDEVLSIQTSIALATTEADTVDPLTAKLQLTAYDEAGLILVDHVSDVEFGTIPFFGQLQVVEVNLNVVSDVPIARINVELLDAEVFTPELFLRSVSFEPNADPTVDATFLSNSSSPGIGDFLVDNGTGKPDRFRNGFLEYSIQKDSPQWFEFATLGDGAERDSIKFVSRQVPGELQIDLVDENGTIVKSANAGEETVGTGEDQTTILTTEIHLNGVESGHYFLRATSSIDDRKFVIYADAPTRGNSRQTSTNPDIDTIDGITDPEKELPKLVDSVSLPVPVQLPTFNRLPAELSLDEGVGKSKAELLLDLFPPNANKPGPYVERATEEVVVQVTDPAGNIQLLRDASLGTFTRSLNDNVVSQVPNVTSANFTLSAWIMPTATSLSGENGAVGSKILDSNRVGLHNDFSLSLLDNRLAFFESTSGGEFVTTKGKTSLFEAGTPKWHHVAVTRVAGGEHRIYVNGALEGVGEAGSGALNSLSDIGLGMSIGNGTFLRPFNGNIDDVAIWNRPLAASEIQAIADGNMPDIGLIGHWPLNEGTGSLANDVTGNRNHGVITGATWTKDFAPHSSDYLFAEPGTHQVRVTAFDSENRFDWIESSIEVVNVAPVATISVPLQEFSVGDVIDLSAAVSMDPDRDDLSYRWTVSSADQGVPPSNDVTFNFVPEFSGDYAVDLTVTDEDGASSIESVTLSIQPLPIITRLGDAAIEEGQAVTFSAETSSPAGTGFVRTYKWTAKYVDSQQVVATSEFESFSMVPPDNGEYEIELEILDAVGLGGVFGTTRSIISVADALPSMTLTGQREVREGEIELDIHLSDPGANDEHVYRISWGDGTPFVTEPQRGPSTTARHRYEEAGERLIRVEVYDVHRPNILVAEQTWQVSVENEAPRVTIEGPSQVQAGERVTLTAQITDLGADTHTLHWVITAPDGSLVRQGDTQEPDFVAHQSGTYSAEVVVADSEGATTIAQDGIEVENRTPRLVDFQIERPSETRTRVVALAEDSVGDRLQAFVDFGNGVVLPARAIQEENGRVRFIATHVHADPSTFSPSIKIIDEHGAVIERSAALPGDTNLDGRVDFSDFLALSASFGKAGERSNGDFDGDGRVAFSDFLLLSQNFGRQSSAAKRHAMATDAAFRAP